MANRADRKPSLLKTIFRTFIWEYFLLALMQILNEFVIRFVNQIFFLNDNFIVITRRKKVRQTLSRHFR